MLTENNTPTQDAHINDLDFLVAIITEVRRRGTREQITSKKNAPVSNSQMCPLRFG